jgi:hypothetical protein
MTQTNDSYLCIDLTDSPIRVNLQMTHCTNDSDDQMISDCVYKDSSVHLSLELTSTFTSIPTSQTSLRAHKQAYLK